LFAIWKQTKEGKPVFRKICIFFGKRTKKAAANKEKRWQSRFLTIPA
jgi:hypothetical protein